jgi:serine/threonine protein kinase/Flp pilus assembly protein TadD
MKPEVRQRAATPAPEAALPSGEYGHLRAGLEPVPGYHLREYLGGGGFGVVWKALGPGGFLVALKFIHVGGTAGRAELKALKVMRDVHHANLLTPFGAWLKHGMLIIAMELADCSLLDRVESPKGMSLPELLEGLLDAAKGVDYLNSKQIQHRDIKPHNLLIVGGSVKVADFGLAKILSLGEHTQNTKMSVGYAAPEYFAGKVSSRSDQYSLAVTYCHLRAKRLPFEGSVAEVIGGHISRPPDLSFLPEAERPVVARALAKEPKQRWPHCKAFIQALIKCHTAPQTAAAKPPPVAKPPAKARPPLPKHPQLAIQVPREVTVEAGEKTTFTLNLLRRGFTDRSTLQFTEVPQGVLLEPITFKRDVSTATVTLQAARQMQPGRHEVIVRSTGPVETAEAFTLHIKLSPAEEHYRRGLLLLQRQQPTEAVKALTEAILLRGQDATAYQQRGLAYFQMQDYTRAVEDFTQAVQLQPRLALAYQQRGLAYAQQRKHLEAIADYTRALQLNPNFALALNHRGLAHYHQRAYERALQDFTEAIRLNPTSAVFYHHRALVHAAKGDHHRARMDREKATALERQQK